MRKIIIGATIVIVLLSFSIFPLLLMGCNPPKPHSLLSETRNVRGSVSKPFQEIFIGKDSDGHSYSIVEIQYDDNIYRILKYQNAYNSNAADNVILLNKEVCK